MLLRHYELPQPLRITRYVNRYFYPCDEHIKIFIFVGIGEKSGYHV